MIFWIPCLPYLSDVVGHPCPWEIEYADRGVKGVLLSYRPRRRLFENLVGHLFFPSVPLWRTSGNGWGWLFVSGMMMYFRKRGPRPVSAVSGRDQCRLAFGSPMTAKLGQSPSGSVAKPEAWKRRGNAYAAWKLYKSLQEEEAY
ncbi:hypothetical protein Tco_1508619 [Tanacetum coccineum]